MNKEQLQEYERLKAKEYLTPFEQRLFNELTLAKLQDAQRRTDVQSANLREGQAGER